MLFVVPAAFVVSINHDNLNIALSLIIATVLAGIGVWLMKLAIRLRIFSGAVMGALPGLIFVLRLFPEFLDSGANLLLLITWLAAFVGVILQVRNKLDSARLSHIGLLDRSPV